MGNALSRGYLGFGLAAAMAASFVTVPALAEPTGPEPGTDIIFELGVGGRMAPQYPGADSYMLSPTPIVKLRFLVLPVLGKVSDYREDAGLAIYPTAKFVGERDEAELTGLKKVDWAIELGGGVRYKGDWVEAFAEVRRGFNGHHGVVGEVGVDALARPSDRLLVKFGPRLTFADSEYMSTYFGVTPSEAVASGGKFSAFKAESGIQDVGVQLQLEYEATQDVMLYADAGYRRLLGDAADSPIVKRSGSANQFTAGIGVTYRFSFNVDGK